MRFLLNKIKSKPTTSSGVASSFKTTNNNVNKMIINHTNNNNNNNNINNNNNNNNNNNYIRPTSKAYGQQCSPNCGCILRFEMNLSEEPILRGASSSPVVLDATFYAKRVIGSSTGGNGSDIMKPLLTTELTSSQSSSRPILTSCTCPTLHHLAQQITTHVPGKTLDQLRNECESAGGSASMGGADGDANCSSGGSGSGTTRRTSIPFRYTVLRENVVPYLMQVDQEKNGWKRRMNNNNNITNSTNKQHQNNAIQQMNHLESRHGHCYDLVEESYLSMLYERNVIARSSHSQTNNNNNNSTITREYRDIMECYSPTLGGYFDLYSVGFRKNYWNSSSVGGVGGIGGGRRRRRRHYNHVFDDDNDQHNDDDDDVSHEYYSNERNYSTSSSKLQEGRDWRGVSSYSSTLMMPSSPSYSPSSYFLFGEDGSSSAGNNNANPMNNGQHFNLTSLLVDQIKESLYEKIMWWKNNEGHSILRHDNNQMNRNNDSNNHYYGVPAAGREYYDGEGNYNDSTSSSPRPPTASTTTTTRPTTTYLQLLDMYGSEEEEEENSTTWQWKKEEESLNGWLAYVDRMQFQFRDHQTSSTSG